MESLDGMLVVPGEIVPVDSLDDVEIGGGLRVEERRVVATRIGTLRVERLESGKYFIYVLPNRPILRPRKDDVVLAEVVNVSATVAQARIFFIFRRNRKMGSWNVKPLSEPYQGLIHISHVIDMRRRPKAPVRQKPPPLYELISIGDKVLGRINVDYTSPYGISIRERDLGVVSSRCGECGAPLVAERSGDRIVLKCERCGKEFPSKKASRLYDFRRFEAIFRRYRVRKYAYTAESEW